MNQGFADALHAHGPAADRAGKMELYGWLVGSWELDVTGYPEDGSQRRRPGEWHCGWVLEGRAIQDVWIVPARSARQGTDAAASGLFYGSAIARSSKTGWRRFRQDDRRSKEVIMYDHVGLHAKDIDASVRFYEAALAALGHVLCSRDDSGAGFGPRQDEPALWLYPVNGSARPRAHAGVHVAFRAADRAAVDRFHAEGLKAGGRDHGHPGVRTDYGPKYYAAFLLDPDGNNVEAVCMR
jgi:catechol 2,3-dioxygenase-like lactoylglutathione lyase family enzyme